MYHLAAVYDLSADEEARSRSTSKARATWSSSPRRSTPATCTTSAAIAAAGLYEGVFREDMFDEAEGLDHPYFMTKHESEKIVRKECKVPWTVYRPALVVGDSTTGEMDKIDGPYYFFKLIQRMRQILPPWFPSVGIEGGRINIVPVDFVVAALDHISHAQGRLNGKCFHLVDPVGYRVGDVLDIFSKAAHAPKMNLFVNAALLGFIPKSVKKGLMALAPMRRVRNAVMKDLGLPEDMLTFINYPTRFDRRETDAALKGSGIDCPKLDTYAWRLWDYWERHLDPDLLDRPQRCKGTVGGKVVLITGGSSGIGLSAAKRFAEAGAITIIAARGEDKLAEAAKEIKDHAGKDAKVFTYSVDIADEAGCAAFVKQLEEEHGGVDFLINNAGRSIRRAIEASYDRFHDFERTMTLNYFGSLRITMGLLPGMVKKRKGHVVNISSISVLVNAPRFSAYVASKAALDAWTACASSEFADQGVTFTTVNMPLVRTPMTAPTKIYDSMPLLTTRRSRRHDRARLHLQAGARGHPAGRVRRGAACRGAAHHADRHEHHLPHVPGQRRGEGRQERQAGAVGRGRGHGQHDAWHPLLRRSRHEGPRTCFIEPGAHAGSACCWRCVASSAAPRWRAIRSTSVTASPTRSASTWPCNRPAPSCRTTPRSSRSWSGAAWSATAVTTRPARSSSVPGKAWRVAAAARRCTTVRA